LGLADDKLVELLLIFGAEVLQALLGFGGDLKLVHGDGGFLVVNGRMHFSCASHGFALLAFSHRADGLARAFPPPSLVENSSLRG
jgi:hypothetical protein